MKNNIFSTFAFLLLTFGLSTAQTTYAPFVKTSAQNKSLTELSTEIISGLESKNFKVVGQYHPMQSNDLLVICFTRSDLQKASLAFEYQGALASVLKIGLQKTSEGVIVSLQNPMYMFYAYFRDRINEQIGVLVGIDKDVKLILSDTYGKLVPFGGALDAEKLSKYHYKIMMPYFDDQTELGSYASFEDGLAYIQTKIASSSNVKEVYKQVYLDKQVAVFGLALKNPDNGEAKFLPIIGESHLAALPYEIILQGKEAFMLHGKFRIALYWPELTMVTFMKIMSTSGDIEYTFREVTKK